MDFPAGGDYPKKPFSLPRRGYCSDCHLPTSKTKQQQQKTLKMKKQELNLYLSHQDPCLGLPDICSPESDLKWDLNP